VEVEVSAHGPLDLGGTIPTLVVGSAKALEKAGAPKSSVFGMTVVVMDGCPDDTIYFVNPEAIRIDVKTWEKWFEKSMHEAFEKMFREDWPEKPK
jgi:hypothetical protein